jgi:hypothetical protein
MTRANRRSSLALSVDSALLANWMGPPKRAKASAF